MFCNLIGGVTGMGVVAVVPIFMSAGAAALPTIIAGLTGLATVILKPRLLFQTIRAHPAGTGIGVGVLAAITVAIWWFTQPPSARPTLAVGNATVAPINWIAVAEAIIAQDRAGKTPTPIAAAEQQATDLMLGRDASRCGFDGGATPIDLKLLWKFKPEATLFLSTPVVAGKRIYVGGMQEDVTGYSGLIACIDSETGAAIWQTTAAGDDALKPVFSSPALTRDGKNLIVGEGLHESHDCCLRCFDTTTGRQRWAVKTTLHIESSPAVFGDIAVAGCGAIEGKDGKPTGDPGHVIGVRISDGKELWRVPVNDPESSPVIDESGIAYIGSGFNGSAIVALRVAPDEELRAGKLNRIVWKTPVAQPVTSPITLAGEQVIAGEGNSDFVYANPDPRGFVAALNRKTGKILWQTRFEDGVLGSIACQKDHLVAPIRTGMVAMLDLSGKVAWKTVANGSAPVLGGVAYTGKRAYAVSNNGFLVVIDPTNGNVTERIALNDGAAANKGLTVCTPQVVGGRVIVGSETGGLQCFVGSRSAE